MLRTRRIKIAAKVPCNFDLKPRYPLKINDTFACVPFAPLAARQALPAAMHSNYQSRAFDERRQFWRRHRHGGGTLALPELAGGSGATLLAERR